MQNDNTKFIFISLNLFILIFFILLASYAGLNNNLQPIQDIFRSFRGESSVSSDLIVLSAEEQKFIKAQSYFKDKLLEISREQKLNISYNNILYEESFNIEEIFASNKLNHNDFKKLISNLMEIEDEAYGYKLSIEILLNPNDILSEDSDLSKILTLTNLFITPTNKLLEINIKQSYSNISGELALRVNLIKR